LGRHAFVTKPHQQTYVIKVFIRTWCLLLLIEYCSDK